jgi:YD repeat-containing protein
VERQAGTHLLLAVTDPLGRRTAFAYDTFGNVTTVTRLAGTPEAVATTLTYEPAFHQVATITDALSRVTTFVYDSQALSPCRFSPLRLSSSPRCHRSSISGGTATSSGPRQSSPTACLA